MAEGRYDYENPEFGKDDEWTAEDDEGVTDFLSDLFGENEETQRIAEQQMESMEHQTGDTLEDTRKK